MQMVPAQVAGALHWQPEPSSARRADRCFGCGNQARARGWEADTGRRRFGRWLRATQASYLPGASILARCWRNWPRIVTAIGQTEQHGEASPRPARNSPGTSTRRANTTSGTGRVPEKGAPTSGITGKLIDQRTSAIAQSGWPSSAHAYRLSQPANLRPFVPHRDPQRECWAGFAPIRSEPCPHLVAARGPVAHATPAPQTAGDAPTRTAPGENRAHTAARE